LVRHLTGDFDRQTRLSRPACAGQRHNAVLRQGGAYVGHLFAASDEARQLHWKALIGNGIHRA
jgi:hypothetical protein